MYYLKSPVTKKVKYTYDTEVMCHAQSSIGDFLMFSLKYHYNDSYRNRCYFYEFPVLDWGSVLDEKLSFKRKGEFFMYKHFHAVGIAFKYSLLNSWL